MKLRRQVPEAVRAVSLDERRLAWALTTTGTPVIATSSALHLPDRVLAWTQIAKVAWAPPVLMVREVADVEDAGPAYRLELETEDSLAEVVRAQVTSSVAWSDVRRLQPAGKVRIVGRRVAGVDALLWQVVWLEGTDPTDPQLRSQADVLVAALRGSLG